MVKFRKEGIKLISVIIILIFILVLLTVISVTQTNERRDGESYVNEIEHPSSNQMGSKEYECSGACFCNDESTMSSDEERRLASPIQLGGRSFSIAMFALTAFTAAKAAGKVFDEKCVAVFRNSCKEDSITSKIGECSEKKDNELTEKEKTCPLCGKPNRCMHGTGKRCWCVDATIPQEIFELIPEESLNKECVCQECIEKFTRGEKLDCLCE